MNAITMHAPKTRLLMLTTPCRMKQVMPCYTATRNSGKRYVTKRNARSIARHTRNDARQKTFDRAAENKKVLNEAE